MSIKNTSARQTKRHTPIVDMLNLVQTTIGILLTGTFGFYPGKQDQESVRLIYTTVLRNLR